MYGTLAEILGMPQDGLNAVESRMKAAGFSSTLKNVESENEELIREALRRMGVSPESAADVREALFHQVRTHEKELYNIIGISPSQLLFDADREGRPEAFDQTSSSWRAFERVADFARRIVTAEKGYFLKKEYAKEILLKRPPERTMGYLGYASVEALLEGEDVWDVFSALRFTETDEWMHKTFENAYRSFTPDDFEDRTIELRVLGPQWKEIAARYVAKKHHNVSHLKEFGIIFLNPIAEAGDGKFLRDFALLLHYFHEIVFYSTLFRLYAGTPEFPKNFLSLLRGDVPDVSSARDKDWLIIQRYLWKADPRDPRLFEPHVNPEAMHWRKAQEDLAAFGKKNRESGLEFWSELWAVAGMFPNASGEKERVSFEMEDNAMGLSSLSDGKPQSFSYHQHEALWNKIFAEYVGGYEQMEKYIVENMAKGFISFSTLKSHHPHHK